MPIEREKNYLP